MGQLDASTWIGLVFPKGAQGYFTAARRPSALENMAMGKAVEEDAVQRLDANEAPRRKVLRGRVIRDTCSRLPDGLGKDKLWRENNIRGASGTVQS